MEVGGLINMGNTCYVNTALQCLLHCQPISDYLKHDSEKGGTIFKEFKALAIELLEHHAKVRPMAFLQCIHRHMSGAINILEQNDIMEFISLFFDKFTKEEGTDARHKINAIISNVKYENTPYDRQKLKMDKDWAEKIGKEYSRLCQVIYGQSISQITCNTCEKIWHNYDIYQDISVAIKGETLEECLVKHFQDVTLTDWKCDKCGGGKGSNRTTLLWRNPQVLIIALKRFDYVPQQNALVKNNTRISVNEILNIDRFCVGKSNKHYVLKSVAFHSGSYHGGHYHALCKCQDNMWYLVDDETTFKVGSTIPDVSSGYVFFYESLAA